MSLKLHVSVLGISLCCIFALFLVGFISCEEEPVVQQRRGVQPIQVAPSATSNGLAKYTSPGNGLQVAPDWIKSLDPNMMRRSNQALEGFRFGHPFHPTVIIERGEMGWRLVLLEEAPNDATQIQFLGQQVEIPFQGEPTSLYKQTGGFEKRDVEWSIPKSLTPNDLIPWKVETAYLLELIDWSIQPYDPQKSPFQQAGKASGRLMLRAKDELGTEGWVVGRFDDAMVRYIGDPKLWETAHP